MGRKARKTALEVAARRRTVYKCSRLGMHPHDIANRLGVSRRTIYRDLKQIRKKLVKDLEKIDWAAEIMAIWYEIKRTHERLLQLYREMPKEEWGNRIRLARWIMESLLWQIRVLQSMGVLNKNTLQVTYDRNRLPSAGKEYKNVAERVEKVMERYREYKKKNPQNLNSFIEQNR
jgi:IS30 family transposase